MSNDLFKVVGSGAVKIPVNQKYPLKDAAKSHKDLEGRKTTGSSSCCRSGRWRASECATGRAADHGGAGRCVSALMRGRRGQ